MKTPFAIIFLFIFSLFSLSSAEAYPPTHFNQAKKIAAQIFAENPTTLYCGCHYYAATNQIDLASCRMQSASDIKRAHRLEWEHMMPAENFGRHLPCWSKKMCMSEAGAYKGRKCCEKMSTQFRHMEAELYNLWPAVGLVNQARSDYHYDEFSKTIFKNSSFYGCAILIKTSLRKVEPRDEAKGIVARANLFMSTKYGIPLSAAQRHLFEVWNIKYPPTPWERAWAEKVAAIEGYTNPFMN